MDRFVVMVDAGYLLHQSVEILSNRATRERHCLQLKDPAGLIQLLVDQSVTVLGLSQRELLRVYWYDGVMSGGLTPQQRSICELPDVNFRAGLVNARGQQKGVDSLIVTDLFELASNRAVTDAALVTGDSDLVIGIDLAQKKGVRIAVIGLEDLAVGVASGQSREIMDHADRVIRFSGAALGSLMSYSPSSADIQGPVNPVNGGHLSLAERASIEAAVTEFISEKAPAADVVDLQTRRIDAEVDRLLIHHVYVALAGGKLTQAQKAHVRACFRERLDV